jgi:hypothetical protein
MLKKISLVLFAVLALGVGFIAVKFLVPMYTVLDKAGPGSAPRDLALQDDSRVGSAIWRRASGFSRRAGSFREYDCKRNEALLGRVTFAYG